MPGNSSGDEFGEDVRQQHERHAAATARGTGTTRGSDRGTCTTASSVSRPKASLPFSRTMKFRLLFWMRGKGRAGSSPSGLSTGSTSWWKWFSSQARSPAYQLIRRHEAARPCAASSGSSCWLRQVYWSLISRGGARVDGRELLVDRRAVRAGGRRCPAPPAASGPRRGSRRIHRGCWTKCTGNAAAPAAAAMASCACASTRWLNSSSDSSRLMNRSMRSLPSSAMSVTFLLRRRDAVPQHPRAARAGDGDEIAGPPVQELMRQPGAHGRFDLFGGNAGGAGMAHRHAGQCAPPGAASVRH